MGQLFSGSTPQPTRRTYETEDYSWLDGYNARANAISSTPSVRQTHERETPQYNTRTIGSTSSVRRTYYEGECPSLTPSYNTNIRSSTNWSIPSPKPIIIKKVATATNTATTSATYYEAHTTVSPVRNESYEGCWNVAKLLEHMAKISPDLAKIFVQLIQEGNTLPFIARYRKHLVNDLPPERLQTIFDCYESAVEFKEKGIAILTKLEKSKKLTYEIKQAIVNAKSSSDLDLINEPLKSAEVSLADYARELGLGHVAVKAMNDKNYDLLCGVKTHPELNTIQKVEERVSHIIGDIIYRDNGVVRLINKLRYETVFTLKCARVKTATGEFTELEDSKKEADLYKLYYNFQCTNYKIQSHQTLAINRGEKVNILAVEIIVPNSFYLKLESFCLTEWKGRGVLSKGISEAYLRFIKPWLTRQVRLGLTKNAEKISIKTFTNNIERLLLTEPLKNKTILGIDPGYRACKIAVIDSKGKNITTKVIFPFTKPVLAEEQFLELISLHGVNVIALGDGKGCRETELWLNKITKVPIIAGVPETGASIYSITAQARKDDPSLDCNLLSALSIARRVLDPLAEYVKLDPKNLGVGMYQHDINPKMMANALDGVIQKVVSLVGADLNTASKALLRRIAGLNDSKADAIIRYRQSCRFRSRKELLNVPNIGEATYKQCAGFLRINGGINPLDNTIIHPESYNIATLFLELLSIPISYVGTRNEAHLNEVKTQMASVQMATMSKKLNTDVFTLKLIANACKQEKEDNLLKFTKQVFSSTALSISQIKEGMIIKGVVRNVVTFGCYVDCGLEYNGLIHISKMNKGGKPQLGDRVSVKVIAPPEPHRISLQLIKILN